MKKIFIDGSAGTTGLRIHERLADFKDIELITLSDEKRKDAQYRKEALNSADFAFLCLPDAAAIEAISMLENKNTAIIDTSTAHRTASGWDYGFPELSAAHRKAIACSKRVAVPGCHASGFIALVYPLVASGIIPKDAKLCSFSLTGYSGGGKNMIAAYGDENRSELYDAPRQYALSQKHKHLPEMTAITGLSYAPVFSPIVADYYSGMEVTVQLFEDSLNGNIDDIKKIYAEKYTSGLVKFKEAPDADGFLSACSLSGRDDMEVSAFGEGGRIILAARFDNLGKGASGAAIQCLNIMRGADEKIGLVY